MQIEKMNPKVKAKWLKALRSGKYKQGEGALKRFQNGEFNYCCLGVLCDIHAKTVKKKGCSWNSAKKKEGFSVGYGAVNNTGGLVVEVQKWSGLSGSLPKTTTNDKSLSLINDQGQSFKEIADIIEKEL